MIYGISKAAVSKDGRTITHVLIHKIVNNTAGEANQVTRQQVIGLIESGYECWTIMKNGSGNWDWGAKVHVVTTYYGAYIRTDRNNESRDNLGNLPVFVPRVSAYSY